MRWDDLLSTERLGKLKEYNETFFETAFERDYYSIINSSHFRRLQGKTQIFTLENNDYVRNRLTHSIEVSSIAETIGKKLAACLRAENPPEGVDEAQWQRARGEVMLYEDLDKGKFSRNLSMILRCSGLLHDIGNPPFGHSGEKYIRTFFEDYFNSEGNTDRNIITDHMYYDLINFEGNAQNLRIAISLGKGSLIKDYPNHGLSLTTAVLSSIIKYPLASKELAEPNAKKGKIGYYHSEEYFFEKIAETVKTKRDDGKVLKNPIMFMMEAADDIAYGTADIEDLMAMGLLSLQDIEAIMGANETNPYVDDKEKLREIFFEKREQSIEEVVCEFINHYSDIMDGNYEHESEGLCNACSFDFGVFKEKRKEIYNTRDEKNDIIHHAKQNMYYVMSNLVKIAKKVDRDIKEQAILDDLKAYIGKGEFEAQQATIKGGSESEAERLYHIFLSVADFVSGMTDRYVEEFAHKIYTSLNEK